MEKIDIISEKLKKKLALLNTCLAIKNSKELHTKFWASKINDIISKFLG